MQRFDRSIGADIGQERGVNVIIWERLVLIQDPTPRCLARWRCFSLLDVRLLGCPFSTPPLAHGVRAEDSILTKNPSTLSSYTLLEKVCLHLAVSSTLLFSMS